MALDISLVLFDRRMAEVKPEVGVGAASYDLTLAAQGGRGTYEWSLGGQAGDTGLSLLKDGRLQGIPGTASARGRRLVFEVGGRDAEGRTDNRKLVLAVRETGFQPRPLRILTQVLPKIVAGELP